MNPAEMDRDSLVNAWGEPNGSLSGLSGGIYDWKEESESRTPSKWPPAEPPKPEPLDVYFLEPPVFLEKELKLCPLARKYLTLTEEEFAKRFSTEELWNMGVFDRLLFDERFEGPVVAGISVGDSIDKVLEELGEPQFLLNEEESSNRLYGYKTPELYFAFETGAHEKKILTICLRRRYPLPEEKKGLLTALAQMSPWLHADEKDMEEWIAEIDETVPCVINQFYPASMSIICGYGFNSDSSGGADFFDNTMSTLILKGRFRGFPFAGTIRGRLWIRCV